MEIGQSDRWRFRSVVALPDDALVRGAQGFDASMVIDTKHGGISLARQLLRSKDWLFDDGRSALLYMVKHFEKHGGDGLSCLPSWLRQREIDQRT